LTIKVLQPTSIIESGVNAGQSTYFMRAASPVAHIYPIDPADEPICDQGSSWIDSAADQNKSTYYTGSNFKDLGDIDWGSKIKSGKMDPQKTLVFLDDHCKVFDRCWNVLMKYGFRHAMLLEDNYKAGEGGTEDDKLV
jgi:trans-aconitate methyltransferase